MSATLKDLEDRSKQLESHRRAIAERTALLEEIRNNVRLGDIDGKRVHRQLESKTAFPRSTPKEKAALIDLYKKAIPNKNGFVSTLDPTKLKSVVDQMYKMYYQSQSRIKVELKIDRKLQFEGGTSCVSDAKGGPPIIYISPTAFTKSPGYLGTLLGHEVVHAQQCARPGNPVGVMLSADKPYYWFGELESHSWAVQKSSFSGAIGPNPFLHNLTKDEKKDFEDRLSFQQKFLGDCLQYVLKNSSTAAGAIDLSRLRTWLGQNDWTNTVWLKNNPNWEKDFLDQKYVAEMCPTFRGINTK